MIFDGIAQLVKSKEIDNSDDEDSAPGPKGKPSTPRIGKGESTNRSSQVDPSMVCKHV